MKIAEVILILALLVSALAAQQKPKRAAVLLQPAFAKLAVKALIASSNGAPRQVVESALTDAETEANTPAEQSVIEKLRGFDSNYQHVITLAAVFTESCKAGQEDMNKLVECDVKGAVIEWRVLTAHCVETWKAALKARRSDGGPHACVIEDK